MRAKKNHYNIRDSYVVYENSTENPIEVNEYVEIVNRFMQFISSELLNVGEIILPERVGRLSILGKKVKIRVEEGKIKGLVPDWAKTKELWETDEEARENKQLVYYFNEDTNGIRYKFFWSKNRVLITNKTLYNLKITRTNKRDLAKLIKNGKEYLIKN